MRGKAAHAFLSRSAISQRALKRATWADANVTAMAAITFPRVATARAATTVWRTASYLALLGVTALVYLWGLDRNGWANAYYAAAVQAGVKSWKAFFFGSLDASSFITVDKSPAFLWVMEIAARVFGFNQWSILVPQALEGVATVAITYVAARRWFGHGAGLLAGAIVATTPVAALMFRYDNPDALLVLLLTAAAYTTLRAVESPSTRRSTLWLMLAAALIGTGFLAKMLQAFVVLPVVILVYLVAGRPRLLTRVGQLVAAGATLVAASGWWVAIVQLWPASDRPYIGGSQDNNLLNLIFGYNGFGRITGNETGSVGGFGALGSRWGITGWNRLFLSDFGGQVSWLIPAALIFLAAGLWLTFRARRTSLARASYLMWGGYLVVSGAVFSFAQGIIHPYYSIALAPAIGALVGPGAAELWRLRSRAVPRGLLALAAVASAVWAYVLLDRSPEWYPALRVAILLAGIIAATGIALYPVLTRPLAAAAAALALVASLAGPAAYTVQTVSTGHSGAIPSAGPAVATTGFGPGGNAPAFRPRNGFPPPGGFGQGGFGGRGGFGGAPQGAGAGFLDAGQVSPAMARLLETDASSYRWVAATVDANSAAGYELATGDAVMAIGGFNGSDPAPTLAQFQAYVTSRQIHYFVGGGMRGGGGTAAEIEAWVASHFTAMSVGGTTVYDLTRPAA